MNKTDRRGRGSEGHLMAKRARETDGETVRQAERQTLNINTETHTDAERHTGRDGKGGKRGYSPFRQLLQMTSQHII